MDIARSLVDVSTDVDDTMVGDAPEAAMEAAAPDVEDVDDKEMSVATEQPEVCPCISCSILTVGDSIRVERAKTSARTSGRRSKIM